MGCDTPQPENTIKDDCTTRAGRKRSSIKFPYADLNHAVAAAQGVQTVGGVDCNTKDLSEFLGEQITSGRFRRRLATGRIFGLVESRRGRVVLKNLGQRILDPEDADDARRLAFLEVELYLKLYERYKDGLLPPIAELEQEMETLGVPTKQTQRVRRTFERSAEQAGFFWQGSNRLTLPITPRKPTHARTNTKSQGGEGLYRNSLSDGGTALHPYIQGLLTDLPEPRSYWSKESRVKWLQMADYIFERLYEGEDDIGIVIEADRWSHREDNNGLNSDLGG